MVLALGPSNGKIRVTSVPMRDACGNRQRRSPKARSNDISHSVVSSAHLTNSDTWNVRRSDHAGQSSFSLRCWRQSRLTLALSQSTGHFLMWRAASWPVSSGPSVRSAALAMVPSDLRRRCRGVWDLLKGSRAPFPPCSCSGSRAGQHLGTSVSASLRSPKACASSFCSSTMTPEALSPRSARSRPTLCLIVSFTHECQPHPVLTGTMSCSRGLPENLNHREEGREPSAD